MLVGVSTELMLSNAEADGNEGDKASDGVDLDG